MGSLWHHWSVGCVADIIISVMIPGAVLPYDLPSSFTSAVDLPEIECSPFVSHPEKKQSLF